jgi:N-acetylglucosaminyldiphosphoundecaprenol N-acetyl-beta-D-mannosaminyltransferase
LGPIELADRLGEMAIDGEPGMAGHGGTTYYVCGVAIAAVTPIAAARRIVTAAALGHRLEVHLCNAYTLSLVDSDPRLRSALERSDLNLPDGTPVAWLGRRRGTDGPVRGPGLVGDVVDLGRTHGLRHYYLGAAPGVAAAMAMKLEATYPGAITASTESPPFSSMDDTALDDAAGRIRAASAHVVWVGLGTPRQDHLVPRLASRLELPVIPVGAAFDFWAGKVTEAPKWLHGTGLEWAHRLASEPRRLWRRYLLGNPRFVASAISHRAGR